MFRFCLDECWSSTPFTLNSCQQNEWSMYRSAFIAFCLSFFLGISVNGQSLESQRTALNNPYNTIYTHLYFLQDEQYLPGNSAKSFPPGIDSIEAVELAIKLKQVLDGKGLFVRMNQIPRDSLHLDTLTNTNIYTLFPKELPEVYVEKVDDQWYYSEETISLIPGLHKRLFPFGLDRILSLLPTSADQKFLGVRIWKYLGFIFLLFFSILIYWLLTQVTNFSLKRVSWIKRIIGENTKQDVFKIARYFSLYVVFWVIKLFIPYLLLPIRLGSVIYKGLQIAQTIFLVFLAIALLSIIGRYLKQIADQTENRMDEQLLPVVLRIIKILVVLIGLFHILHLLEVNVTALIAGISIGGLALALAAQDTVKNLIGSVLIFMDKPFQVGDYITGSGFEGTVEEVGFRSTRLRHVDTSIISIPNGQLINMTLKNLGVRIYRMMSAKLGIMYNTPSTKVEAFITDLRRMILEHPKMHDDNRYVFLNSLDDSAITIMFRAYFLTNNFQEELALKQEIYLEILSIAEKHGVSFAFPSQSIYVENLPDSLSNAE